MHWPSFFALHIDLGLVYLSYINAIYPRIISRIDYFHIKVIPDSV